MKFNLRNRIVLTVLLSTFFFVLCEGGTIRENLQSFAKRVLSFGIKDHADVNPANVTNAGITPSRQMNDTPSASPSEASTSLTEEEALLIKRLCPELQEVPNIMQFRYFEEKQKCQQLQYKGACGTNMIFYLKHGVYGECGCKHSRRILAEHTESNECYPIFSQGFCPEGQWIDITPEATPICVNNPCSSATTERKQLVMVQGQCVELGTRTNLCPSEHVTGFEWARRKPMCIPDVERAVGVPLVKCPPGTVRAHTMKCVTPVDVDFD